MAENKKKENQEAEDTTSEAKSTANSSPKSSRSTKSIIRFGSVFGVFKRNEIAKSMPFVLFVTALIIFYIGNSYYAEKMVRDIEKTKAELKERRAEYISTMSLLMIESKQSEVAKEMAKFDLKESTEPPQKIFVEQKKSAKH